MPRVAAVLLVLSVHSSAIAQELKGMVLDRETKDIIVGAVISNLNSHAIVFSDSDGHYSIPASAGDTILFRHAAYKAVKEVMTYTMRSKYKSILMQQDIHKLKEATISVKTKYQQDSQSRHEAFHHELTRVLVPKPQVYGIGCAGCIGWLADKITGNSKKPKRFRKNFAAEDEAKFVDSRYNPELVTELTPLRDIDSIAAFIRTYPMPYDYARAATELEIKAWVKYNYKLYIQQPAGDIKK